jgi:hypothetical protein
MDSNDFHPIQEHLSVILDSRNASNIYNGTKKSQVNFNPKTTLYLSKNAIKTDCCVSSFFATNSFYLINEYNNFLSITFTTTLVNTTYIIPSGNYNIRTFETVLSSLLGTNFTISYSSVNNKITITHSSANFQINSGSTIGSVIGFDTATIYTSTNKTFTCPFIYNFNGIQSFNIHIENISTRNIDSYSMSVSSILQTIPVDPNSTVINYIKNDDTRYSVSEREFSNFIVSIKDDLGRDIDFNNQDWKMVLSFSVLYDVDRFQHENSFQSISNGLYRF